ncbi:MAG: zf-HC2 domain-containing protein [Terriglobales bacterium]
MTEVPKIVHDRLRGAALERVGPGPTTPAQAHPDADVLTAFAEQALSASERENVLEHLARCGDCRELIALALPPADFRAAPTGVDTAADRAAASRAGAPALHRLKFAWPTLRWAALAAGVVVAAAVLLVHPGKLNQVAPSANRAAVPVASGSQIATSIASSPAAPSPVATPSTDQFAVLAKTEGPQPRPELRASKKLKAGRAAMPPHPAEYGMLLADNKKDSSRADKAPAAPSAGARAFNGARAGNNETSAGRGANETVAVSGVAAGVETESSSINVMAQNEMPVVKAKPAPQAIGGNGLQKAEGSAAPATAMLQARNVMSKSGVKLTSSASPALANHVTWAIRAGVLQRSLDSGQSWQEALRVDYPLLCYASHDQDVWAGGQAGTLFHSADSGVTWLQVQPSINALLLTSDITHIEVRGPAEVVISTSHHEFWSSADSGKTWEKK